MFIQYVNSKKPQDCCEQASNLLLAPTAVAVGRKIDVRTGLRLPQHHIATRAASATLALLLFPVTLLGIALQYKSATYWQHSLPNTPFKPIALVVAAPNWEEVKKQMLGSVIAACRDIEGNEPQVIQWQSGISTFTKESASGNEPLEAKKLFSDYTVILLSQVTAGWRVYRRFQHDGYFSSMPQASVQKEQIFAIIHHTYCPGFWSNAKWESIHEPSYAYVTRTYKAIPTVVWNILNTVRAPN